MHSDGGRPIWNDLLMIVQRQLILSAEKSTQKQLLIELKHQMYIKKANIWKDLGCDTLNRCTLTQLFKINDSRILGSR